MSDVTIGVTERNTKDLTLCQYRVLRTLFPDVPIIVHDDASTDGTLDLLARECKRDPNLRVLSHAGPPIRHGLSMNAIMDAAETEFVLLLDSDVAVLSDELLVRFRHCLEDHPIAYGCGRVLRTVPASGGIIYLAPWFVMIRKSVWQAYPRFERRNTPCYSAMKQINDEDRVVELLVDLERLSPDEAKVRPARNVLKGLAIHAEHVTYDTRKG